MLSSPVVSPHTTSAPVRTPIDVDTICFVSQEQKVAISTVVQDLTVGPKKLLQIKDHFVGEMKKGLAKDGETLAMVPTYVVGRLTGSGNVLSFLPQNREACISPRRTSSAFDIICLPLPLRNRIISNA